MLEILKLLQNDMHRLAARGLLLGAIAETVSFAWLRESLLVLRLWEIGFLKGNSSWVKALGDDCVI